MKSPTGTKEWADKNINLFKGFCANGCLYCYATANIIRYKQNQEWKVREDVICKSFNKRDYLTMYPSAHDIRFEDIEHHVTFLTNFLKSRSNILIVSKPSPESINRLCAKLINFKDQIEFRFTVGSTDNKTLKFFEPNAPSFEERKTSLMIASHYGYKTSLSIEPMLDDVPYGIINRCYQYVSGDIWIGKVNNIKARMSLNGHKDKIEEATRITEWQNDDYTILSMVDELNNSMYKNMIKWKDSIKEVIERNK